MEGRQQQLAAVAARALPAAHAAAAIASCETLCAACVRALQAPSAWAKAAACEALAARWRRGGWRPCASADPPPPEQPAADARLTTVAPNRTKRTPKKGSHASRLHLLHSLAHIEAMAVCLALDCIARFGKHGSELPTAFYDDFVEVAADECRHFRLLAARLEEAPYGTRYGALEVHDGLWRSARETAGDFRARLAVEHMVHEARGLDVLPSTIRKFRDGGDEDTATLLEETVMPEEVSHCGAGLRWFCFATALEARKAGLDGAPEASGDSHKDEETARRARGAFVDIVPKYFRGRLKPPFNDEARAAAGFTPAWYEPLSQRA